MFQHQYRARPSLGDLESARRLLGGKAKGERQHSTKKEKASKQPHQSGNTQRLQEQANQGRSDPDACAGTEIQQRESSTFFLWSQARHQCGKRNVAGQRSAVENAHRQGCSEAVVKQRDIVERESRHGAAKPAAQPNCSPPPKTVAEHTEEQIPDDVAREDDTQET